VSILPHVNEANGISEELDAKKSFEIVLVSALAMVFFCHPPALALLAF
jgi:hypothetical protein